MVKKIILFKLFPSKTRSAGFTLMEIIISVGIFTTFVATFVMIESYNLNDSIVLKEELELRKMAQLKMNFLIITPPSFEINLTKTEKGTFEEHPHIEYRITYKKFPDMSLFLEKAENEQGSNVSFKQAEKFTKYLRIFLLQAEVTVTNTMSLRKLTLTRFLYDSSASFTF